MNMNPCGTSRFPVSHKKLCLDIKMLHSDFPYLRLVRADANRPDPQHTNLACQGNKTDFVISCYDDHFMVIVTQIGSMGTMLHARKEESVSIDPTFNVSVIFGKRDEPLLVACARQLIEHISSCGSSRQLVLSLGLKDHSLETLKGIVSAVTENRMW